MSSQSPGFTAVTPPCHLVDDCSRGHPGLLPTLPSTSSLASLPAQGAFQPPPFSEAGNGGPRITPSRAWGRTRHSSSLHCPSPASTQGHGLGTRRGIQLSVPALGPVPSSKSFPLPFHLQTLRHGLRKAEEQAQRQEQLLRARDGELQTLQKQLHR